MKKILVVTTFNNHFYFFNRLAKALRKLNYETHFATNKYSILRESKNSEIVIHSLKRGDSPNSPISNHKSFEEAAGFVTEENASMIVSAIHDQVEKFVRKNKYEYLFLWGGVRLIEMVASTVAEKYGIKTIFFELSNFPEKIFVDPKGTNARSLLAQKPSLLKNMSYDIEKYHNWQNQYRINGLELHSVPQSNSAINVEYTKNIYDLVGFSFKNFVQTEPILTKEKLIGKYLRQVIKLDYDEINLDEVNYIFYPMQVNKDAQLILNSEVCNLEGLEIANRIAKERGIKLLVKPHPGEVELGFIRKVNKLKDRLGFAFVSGNTIEIIDKAQEVITINSTVGLQAKILGKKVTCLGKAFYNDFDEQMIAAYIQSYLIDCDFWGDSQISGESAKEILRRAELSL